MVKSYLRYRFATDFGVVSSPDSNVILDQTGTHLFAGVNEFVYKWNPRTSEATTKVSVAAVNPDAVSSGYVTHVAKHPTAPGLVAVGYSDGSIRLWDMEERQLLVTFHGHKTGVSALQFRSVVTAACYQVALQLRRAHAGVRRLGHGHCCLGRSEPIWALSALWAPEPRHSSSVCLRPAFRRRRKNRS